MHNSAPILIIHQGALGDLMLSLPALYSLRQFSEGIPWTVAGNPEILSLLYNRFYAQEIVSIHQKEWAYLFQEETSIPDLFRQYLSSFQKAFSFSAGDPVMLRQGLTRAGLEKVLEQRGQFFQIDNIVSISSMSFIKFLSSSVFTTPSAFWFDSPYSNLY